MMSIPEPKTKVKTMSTEKNFTGNWIVQTEYAPNSGQTTLAFFVLFHSRESVRFDLLQETNDRLSDLSCLHIEEHFVT